MSKLIPCQICGRAFRSVGHHVRRAHGISATEYRDMHGIPRSTKLTEAGIREVFAANMRRRHQAGEMEETNAKLRAMSAENGKIGAEVRRDLATIGRRFGGVPVIDEIVAEIVAQAEAGGHPWRLVREAGISWSGFHAALRRNPAIHRRYKALPISKGRSHIAKG